jgi:endonuclease-3
VGLATAVTERYESEVPSAMEDLVTLPGVGRKTANVVRSVDFGLPGLPVDTHVLRLSHRLGLTDRTDPVKVEADLNAMIPAGQRGAFSLRMILHGRATCTARSPQCGACALSDFCPTAPRPTR